MKFAALRFFVALLVLFSCSLRAQTVADAATHNMNRAMSGIIQNAMQARGYVPSDPRTYSTLSRASNFIGTTAGSAAALVTIGSVTAPAWATFALAAGVGAVISYGVTVGLDGLVKWLFGDKEITVTSSAESQPLAGISVNGSYWSAGSVNGAISGGDGIGVARQAYSVNAARWGVKASPICSYVNGGMQSGIAKCTASEPDVAGSYLSTQALFYSSGSPGSCSSGQYWMNGTCAAYSYESAGNFPNATPQQAISALPQAELDKALNPQIVAALANRVWQQAASQAGYDGLPYPMAQPITAAEVTKWTEANPQYAPKVRDFVAPNTSTATQTQPWALPSNPTSPVTTPTTVANPNITNPASQSPLINLGPDPGVGSPSLERIPTAQEILDPILNLLPGHKNFVAQGQAGQCPTPTIQLYGSHMLTAHCTLIDQNKSVIQAVMAFAWAAIALFIILSA